MLIAAVFGRGIFYYLTIASILLSTFRFRRTLHSRIFLGFFCKAMLLQTIICHMHSDIAAGVWFTPTEL